MEYELDLYGMSIQRCKDQKGDSNYYKHRTHLALDTLWKYLREQTTTRNNYYYLQILSSHDSTDGWIPSEPTSFLQWQRYQNSWTQVGHP